MDWVSIMTSNLGPAGRSVTHDTLRGRMLISTLLAGVITAVEIIGGLLSNSLALLADAGHVGTDAISLAITVFAMNIAARPHTPSFSYGYHRAEVLAALTNGATLLIVSTYIFSEAYRRILTPLRVEGELLLVTAVTGLAANIFIIFLLKEHFRASINVRGAFFHVLGDTLSSVVVVVGAVIGVTLRIFVVDSIGAVLIGILLVYGALQLMKDAARILLEAAPRKVDETKMVTEFLKIRGVKSVHDLHVWTLTSGMDVLSAHVVVDEHVRDHIVLDELRSVLRKKFNITHVTVQVEHQTELVGLHKDERKE